MLHTVSCELVARGQARLAAPNNERVDLLCGPSHEPAARLGKRPLAPFPSVRASHVARA
jgi:hypothetical protein